VNREAAIKVTNLVEEVSPAPNPSSSIRTGEKRKASNVSTTGAASKPDDQCASSGVDLLSDTVFKHFGALSSGLVHILVQIRMVTVLTWRFINHGLFVSLGCRKKRDLFFELWWKMRALPATSCKSN